jgi:hypothetical protein
MCYRFFIVIVVLIAACALINCNKKSVPEPEINTGRLELVFEHYVNGSPLEKNSLIYVNAAGNPYLVTEVKYFISDITLYPGQGNPVMIHQSKDIFYIDDDILATLDQLITDPIPVGTYDSLRFIFGISESENISNRYVNPPEVFMSWPEVIGGGYHYMMLNGKWQDTAGVIRPFNFHLGIGQLYKGNVINVDSIYAFVQNYFIVRLPDLRFEMKAGDTMVMNLRMNIESWFATPYVYDHNYWGGNIMQNQPAMQMARENGFDVFTAGIVRSHP